MDFRYIVNIDSSVLGANCDGYEHRYIDVREHTKDLDFFTPKIGMNSLPSYGTIQYFFKSNPSLKKSNPRLKIDIDFFC